MNKFAKALLLALIFAAPLSAFASEAQAKTVYTHNVVKSAKVHQNKHYKHHKNHKHHAKNVAVKAHK
ncbi:hypothetical protein ANSO36C_37440 [Nostoc cf. commune SO-36]|uniref:Uncharacterized protein n=1 Tax=Nostoc cf. commune SO-36 TaxID=449208 RepID=A0ABM7Z4I0_NOSCO|nr:hypothetical protein [Nostoc commune]BDI17942.1 hypothetical protein ANSO36C_37440 [Nostoc cf. commune SO-36]